MIIDRSKEISDYERASALYALTQSANKVRRRPVRIVVPVVYTFFDERMKPLYTGKTVRFKQRYNKHKLGEGRKNGSFYPEVKYLGVVFCPSCSMMDLMEMVLIDHRKPKYNREFTDKDHGRPKSKENRKTKTTDVVYRDVEGYDLYSNIDVEGYMKEYIFTKEEIEEWCTKRL